MRQQAVIWNNSVCQFSSNISDYQILLSSQLLQMKIFFYQFKLKVNTNFVKMKHKILEDSLLQLIIFSDL